MKKGVTVIGDIMIDKYVYGNIERLNPEEPGAFLLKVDREECRLGGAANVAVNIANLGIDTVLVGAIGIDSMGEKVAALTKEYNVSLHAILHGNPTIVKERAMFHQRQLGRIDREKYNTLSSEQIDSIITTIKNNLTNILVFSDYGKGMANGILLEEIHHIAKKNDVQVVADVKPQNIDLFKNIGVIKPNFSEFVGMIGKAGLQPTDIDDIAYYGVMKARQLNTILVVTRGGHGASILRPNGDVAHVPAIGAQSIDPTGAGDSFLAGMTYGLHHNKPMYEAVTLGVAAGGAVVQRVGTSIVSLDDLVIAQL